MKRSYGVGRVYWRGPQGEPEGAKAKRGSYHIAWCADGYERRESAKTRIKSIAEAKLKARLRAALHGEIASPRLRKITIGDLIADLETYFRGKRLDDRADDLEMRWRLHMRDVFDRVPAHSLTTVMLSEYKAKRSAAGAAVATVNRELQFIRRAFTIAARSHPPKVSKIPHFDLDREQNACFEFFTPAQVDTVRMEAAKLGVEWRAYVELAYALGWRRKELLAIQLADIDLLAGSIRIATSKNGEPRTATLTPKLKALVAAALGNRKAGRLFASIDVGVHNKKWPKIAKAAGVQKFHSFRRTSARDKRAAGVDTSVIMNTQGWKTFDMFKRYAIVSPEDQLDEQRKLDAYQKQIRTTFAQNDASSDKLQ